MSKISWTIKGMFIVDLRPASKVVSTILNLAALSLLLYGIISKSTLWIIAGAISLLLFLAFTLPSIFRITVDRSNNSAYLRLMILPFMKFSYPLESVSVQLSSNKSPISGRDFYVLRWNQDLSNLEKSVIARGIRPQSLKLYATYDQEDANNICDTLEKLLASPDEMR